MSSRTKQILQTVIGLGLAAAMLIWGLPYFAKTSWTDIWSVVGSTNFDNRSFGINDEVNLAVFDVDTAQRLARDFAEDLANSKAVNYWDWSRRSLIERGHEWLGWLLERQQ